MDTKMDTKFRLKNANPTSWKVVARHRITSSPQTLSRDAVCVCDRGHFRLRARLETICSEGPGI